MFFKRIVFWVILVSVIGAINHTPTFASPVLIKLELKSLKDYQVAKSLKVTPYQRFGNVFLSEIDSEMLGRLRDYHIEYEVVDADPWSEHYFIVSSLDPAKKEFIPRYEKILVHEEGFDLLKVDWKRALELQRMGFTVTHIPRKPIPLEYSPPLQLNKEFFEYSSDLDSLVDLVSQDSLWAYVKRLQDFLSRFTWADSIVPAREWIYDKFVEFGCDRVFFDEFAFYYGGDAFGMHEATQYNVVAIVEGTVNPDKVIVVGGHYDSIVWDPTYMAFTQAPGADDNATGTVAAMEQARIIAQNRLPCTVIFIAFAGEELGLWGAWDYASKAAFRGDNILLMMNYDMIGELANQSTMTLFKDQPALPYAQIFAEMATLYNTPSLDVVIAGSSSGSDQWPFWQYGYNAFFAHEYVFSSQYHAPSDSITYINFDYMEKVVRAGFATLVTLANHPGSVRGVDYVDAGDGERLYINWLPNPENDLVSYFVYWGIQRGLYDSVHVVPATYTSDTLYGLSAGTSYYVTVTAYNDRGNESLVYSEITAIPRVVPAAPQGLMAEPGVDKIILNWQANKEADLDHYDIFRSTSSQGGFDLLTSGIQDTLYEDTAVEGGNWYYYYITAIDTTELESETSEIDSSRAITLDQGILVIDETANGNGKPGNPSDAQQDSFYAELFADYKFDLYEYSWPSQAPELEDIAPYSTVVWLDDDITQHYLQEVGNSDLISEYLDLGGNFVWCSWTGLEKFGSMPFNYSEGSFVYDYLHIQRADWNQEYDFIGAKAFNSFDYPEVKIDTSKLKSIWEEKLYGIVKLNYHGGAEPIYLYDSFNDTADFEDSVCGIKYLGPEYGVIFLSFPIFYLEKDNAKGLIEAAMRDLGEPATGIEEEGDIKASAKAFVLSQNYPNPFNATTLIPFRINSSQSTENGPIQTSIAIYNILGQKVKTLLNEEKLPGNYTVIWDGKDEKGKDVASGIYFYRLISGDFQESRKMLFLK
ncbi:MAG: M28 family peptidase [Candidatus Zixiibacteriota bacterium]